jgi:bifunctional UDP-N-acetylglucosamine pyrophosphorylase/glucosamine-1-phosphate N-acetyltransferase
VTVDTCALGPKVELKGGYFKQSVFLEKANMGSGAQVREACLLEEEANGAHCVGLKQTILFPFVTLGSLINFCDCLMAGGTSRKDHSEVGSSYIHFNYTPDGDKTTASLFGDVPRGVMLNQPAIFLGGQGGTVGPVRLGYGTVIAAGSVLRDDVIEDRKLVFVAPPPGLQRGRHLCAYKNLTRVVRNNLLYMAGLVALEQWYRSVRLPYFERQELGGMVYKAALEVLSQAKDERAKRLEAMAGKVSGAKAAGKEFRERAAEVCALFAGDAPEPGPEGAAFLAEFKSATTGGAGDYIQAIQGLTPALSARGTQWLQQIVATLCQQADALLPSMGLFDSRV